MAIAIIKLPHTWYIVGSATSGTALTMRIDLGLIHERCHVLYMMVFVTQIGRHVSGIVEDQSHIFAASSIYKHVKSVIIYVG